jgi:uncharacterized damage-inducible protein DinB
MDAFLERHVPGPPIRSLERIAAARAATLGTVETLAHIDDAVLGDVPWPWRGSDDIELRYGFYRLCEMFDEAAADARRALARANLSRAQAAAGSATAARWDLQGILVSLDEETLDADPGNKEWTLRQTLAHVINSQRAYNWFTAWWLARRDGPADDFPVSPPDDAAPDFPEESSEGAGELATVRARIDDVLDQGASALGALDEPSLRVRARWSHAPVDVGFRIGRWASHIREHTVQVEKTLAFLGRSPSEVDRLVRLVLAAYGRMEAAVFAVPAPVAGPADPVLQRVIGELREVTAGVADAAGIAHSRSNR